MNGIIRVRANGMPHVLNAIIKTEYVNSFLVMWGKKNELYCREVIHLTLCYNCKKSIEIEHDQRDLMRCLKFISVQLNSVESHTENLAKNTGWLE